MPLPITGMGVSAALTEALGLSGKLPLRCDETVVPTITVGNLEDAMWGPPAIGGILLAAAAGFRCEVEVSIPQQVSGMGAAAILDRIEIAAGTATTVDMGVSPGFPAPNVFGVTNWRDMYARGTPLLQLNGANNAVGTVGMARLCRWRVDALTTLTIDLGWVLRESAVTGLQQGILLRPSIDNKDLGVNFYWRERSPR